MSISSDRVVNTRELSQRPKMLSLLTEHSTFLRRLLVVLLLWPASRCEGQNVTGYDSMPNPYLLLLREPAVWQDLQLSDEQEVKLQAVNDRVDGPLLSLRNQPPEKSNLKLKELIAETRQQVDQILSIEQRARLGQILLRLQGIKLVAIPQVADRLELTDQQRTSINEIVNDAAQQIDELRGKLQAGAPREDIEREANLARRQEQRSVLGQMTPDQQRALTKIVGRKFDSTELGRVKFKAPDLTQSASWINSKPLRLEDLRGKVVAVHFWAFM